MEQNIYCTDYDSFQQFLEEENEIFDTEYVTHPQKKKRKIKFYTFEQYADALTYVSEKNKKLVGFVYSDFSKHVAHETSCLWICENGRKHKAYSYEEFKKRANVEPIGFIPLNDDKILLVCKRKHNFLDIFALGVALIVALITVFMS